jgi:hypothetical protein
MQRLDDVDRRRHRFVVEAELFLHRLVGQRRGRLDLVDRAGRLDEALHPVDRQVVVAAVAGAAPRVLDDHVAAAESLGRRLRQVLVLDVADRDHRMVAARALTIGPLNARGPVGLVGTPLGGVRIELDEAIGVGIPERGGGPDREHHGRVVEERVEEATEALVRLGLVPQLFRQARRAHGDAVAGAPTRPQA